MSYLWRYLYRWRSEIMKTPVTKREAVERIAELEEIIAGAQAKEELLLDYIDNIGAIIAYECSLKDQDSWMSDAIDRGFFKPDKELLDMLIEDGRVR